MDDIKRGLIVATENMGYFMAFFAKEGLEVRLVDKESKSIERPLKLIESASHTLIKAGLVTKDYIPKLLQQIEPFNDLKKESSDSNFAIESVDDKPAIKKQAFHLPDGYCPQYTILASITSALNIFDIIETRRPEKVVITHFFRVLILTLLLKWSLAKKPI